MNNFVTSSLHGVVIGTTVMLLSSVAIAEPEAGEAAPPQLAPGPKMSLSVEPSLAIGIVDPKADRAEPGFGQTLKLLFGVNRYLAVGPVAAFTALDGEDGMDNATKSWSFGGGARVMRPHDALGFGGVSPWVDGDLRYVRATGLSDGGFATAAGLSVPLDDRRRFWVGPYGRYFQILRSDRLGFDNRDYKILELGVSFEVSSGLEHKHRAAVVVAAPAAYVAPPAAVVTAPAPVYKAIIVKPDRIELNERIAFEWDSAKLEDMSFPMLDEVAQALLANPAFHVQVDGHASSEGGEAHNQSLSEARAAAVLDYLVSRGVARDRLASKGFSSSVPVATNTTEAGRVTNRRVEFALDLKLFPAPGQ